MRPVVDFVKLVKLARLATLLPVVLPVVLPALSPVALAAPPAAGSAAPPPAGGATVVVFRSAELGAEEGRLIDALRIYTRDLDCRVLVAGKAPSVLDPTALEAVARQARGEGAELATWVGRREGTRPVYFLLSVRDLDLRETEIAELGADRAAQEIGLKVRTLLSWTSRLAPDEAARPGSPAPRAEAVGAGAPPASPSPAAPPPPSPSPAAAEVAVPPSARPEGTLDARRLTPDEAPGGAASFDRPVVLRAGYAMLAPAQPGGPRQGVMLSVELRLGPGPFSLFADGALTTRAKTAAQGFESTLGDVPIGAGLQRRWAVSSIVSFAAGPRVALHAFDATTVSSDGQSGSSRRLSAGAGGLGRVDVGLAPRVRVYAGLSLEVIVPAQKFTASGNPAIETGRFLLGATAGVAIPVL